MSRKVTAEYRAEARVMLLKYLKPGDTVYTRVIHVAPSGMSRVIDAETLYIDGNGKPAKRWLSRVIATALGDRYDENHEGVYVSGCGMNMCRDLVYRLSCCIFQPIADEIRASGLYDAALTSDPGYWLNYGR